MVQDERLTVLISTAYLDEAERCAKVFVLHEGKLLGADVPEQIRAVPATSALLRSLRQASRHGFCRPVSSMMRSMLSMLFPKAGPCGTYFVAKRTREIWMLF